MVTLVFKSELGMARGAGVLWSRVHGLHAGVLYGTRWCAFDAALV